jgi:hypothetical protein
MNTGTAAWVAAVVACIAAGVVFWLAHPANFGSLPTPKGMGYIIAMLAFVGGLAFGWRGAVLPLAGLGAYGLAGLIDEFISPTTGPGSGDVRGIYLLYFTFLPALFAVPALVGALLRAWLAR